MNHKVVFLDHIADPNLVILKCECGLAPGCTSEIAGADLPISEGLRALAQAFVTEMEAIFTPSAAQANTLPGDHEWCGRYLRLPMKMIEEIDWSVEVVISAHCPILDVEPSLPTIMGDDFCIASKRAAFKAHGKNCLYMRKKTHISETKVPQMEIEGTH